MILRHDDYGKSARYDADVVVVGTGAGGAAAGATLAKAGLDVIFVEEGSYHPTSSFNPYATETVPRIYRDASSTVIFGSPDIPYLEGRCVGGSTVLNGGMAYRAPEAVLDTWAKRTGLEELGPKGMDSYFSDVEERVHVGHQLEASVGGDSRIMEAGARKLGWKYEVNRRNQEACVGANNCVFGCPTGAKQSALVTYVPDALAAGARCLTEIRVEEILVERGRAVGVRGRAVNPRTRRPGPRVVVRARAVVVAGGAVQTPYLLLRHRLGRPSGRLGKNLLCHPNVKVLAVYPFDVQAWKGVNQYGQIREFDDDGILFAENMVPPGAMAALIPCVGRGAWDLMRRYDQIVATGVLVEDSTTGTVSRGPFGLAMPKYFITARDHERFVRGAKLLAELHFAMGAEYVVMPFSEYPFVRSPDELRKLSVASVPAKSLELLTVHLMGTAAMGGRPEDSVVDPSGELWDLPGCHVADASLFPTAIGRNPQITILALALRVGERLAERLLSRKVA
ncbi:MAG TPA: GMC family oxidoreductase N-terminal domain-containing protein [Polyangiaceae bacterium]|nr:GMC family oxidoreductase N-terminal domain-containing protein [Polyangiaceae bacterium]